MDRPPRDVVVILRRARSELAIAEHALLLGDQALPDAAVHLLRALYAHACLCTIDQELPLPGFREFLAGANGQLHPEGSPPDPAGGQAPLGALVALSERESWLPPSTPLDLRQEIRRQVTLLTDRLGKGPGPEVPRPGGELPGARLIKRHRVLIYALVVVLATVLSLLPFIMTYHAVLTSNILPFSSDATLATLEKPKPRGLSWNARGCIPLTSPLSIPLSRTWRPVKLNISLDNNDKYELSFFQWGRYRGSLVLGPTVQKDGLALYLASLPPVLRGAPVDRIVVRPLSGDGNFSIGHLILFEKDTKR